jgi:hypothetical protein
VAAIGAVLLVAVVAVEERRSPADGLRKPCPLRLSCRCRASGLFAWRYSGNWLPAALEVLGESPKFCCSARSPTVYACCSATPNG